MLLIATEGLAWGQKGHDVTCAVAEKHLTKRAKRHIKKVLEGKSIVYWANWLDNASHTPEYEDLQRGTAIRNRRHRGCYQRANQ